MDNPYKAGNLRVLKVENSSPPSATGRTAAWGRTLGVAMSTYPTGQGDRYESKNYNKKNELTVKGLLRAYAFVIALFLFALLQGDNIKRNALPSTGGGASLCIRKNL